MVLRARSERNLSSRLSALNRVGIGRLKASNPSVNTPRVCAGAAVLLADLKNAEEARSAVVRLDVPLPEALGRIRTGNRSFVKGVLSPLSYKGTGSLLRLHLNRSRRPWLAAQIDELAQCKPLQPLRLTVLLQELPRAASQKLSFLGPIVGGCLTASETKDGEQPAVCESVSLGLTNSALTDSRTNRPTDLRTLEESCRS
jgi:hypothetical protein